MDKVSSDRDRSTRRSYADRDSTRDHHRDRDRERDKDHHRDRDRDHHRHHDKHRSKEEDYSPSDRDSRRDSVEREVSVERHRHSSYRKRKDHEEEDRDRERESKKARASEERNGSYKEDREDGRRDERRERREGRRFSDRKNTDERRESKYVHDEGLKEREKVVTNGEHKSGSKADEAAKEPQTVTSAAPTTVSHPIITTKVSSIPSTNENEGVSIRSDEVTAKSSTDGGTPAPGKSTTLSSLDALAKAKKALQLQKELKEKLKKLPVLNKVGAPSSDNKTQVTAKKEESKPAAMSGVEAPIIAGIPATAPNLEAVKKAQELAARMGFRQDPEFAPLINMFPGSSATDLVVPQKPSKAPVLRLDAQGREIDEHGNVISMSKPSNLSTLKVNINKKKKEAFQIIKPDFDAIAESSSHFDPRMGINKNKLMRPKRPSFQFVEEGQMSKMADIQRIKSQFGEAQAKELKVKQAQLAKAKAEPDINPNLIAVGNRVVTKQKPKEEEMPDIEWWDKVLLKTGQYEEDLSNEKLNMEKITHYIEHPRPIEPPAEPARPPPQPLKLTPKERKKLRTQTRIAKEKDRQEMIRQGLLEPPKPKVKMSNLMRVLGSEATQDPTRMEMEVRSAAAEREQAHADRNTMRKLTPAERREKKERKLFEDPYTLETLVSVYKIRDLSDPKARFKVDMNARQNRMTGVVVRSDGMTVVVVEGGKKSIKRYGKLMLNRIDWSTVGTGEEGEDEEMEDEKPPNSCVLVWQGSVAKPSFHKFIVHDCRSDAAARKVFADAGVPHYWDLAVNYTEE
ncbi:U4/U6 small nuclear ribonucleoprotein Prp3 isoform X1 [Carex littledalei]|uniref:U4/U6 small nuclear ribonucleoprotein Prp3 isoform X1 n=1 Tax=Carex littledalei TaxID=544730 RepID=A0A833VFQ2_9POAL|nr:U4/U6 small nuclear ribonucleoprotein Prp3 isoform X1 [Carex littledalei]